MRFRICFDGKISAKVVGAVVSLVKETVGNWWHLLCLSVCTASADAESRALNSNVSQTLFLCMKRGVDLIRCRKFVIFCEAIFDLLNIKSEIEKIRNLSAES